MKTPDTINGKTPEEIKKGLCCCVTDIADCKGCPFDNSSDDGLVWECTVDSSAIAYIQQLESRLAQAERERDAAVNALRENGFCCDCKYIDVPAEKEPCFSCRKLRHTQPKNWERRGVVPGNTKEKNNEQSHHL